MSKVHPQFPPPRHNHLPCMRAALSAAETMVARRGLRFTPMRRRVLEIILRSHRPMGAYDVLHALAERAGGPNGKQRPAPPTVYRALDFLLREGLVHRIDSLNAFAACFAPGQHHRAHFLLCRQCGCVAEIAHGALDSALAAAATAAGFAAERETVEIAGLCGSCAGKPDGPSMPAPSS